MRGYLRRRRGRDAGVTMVAVLAAFTILMVVVLGSLAYLTASTKYSRYEQDTDLALAAAQSGVSDLLSRLRADPDYLSDVAGTKDDPTGYCQAAFTGAPPQSSEGALDGDYFAADCGWTAGTEAKVAEFGAGSAAERFHYMVTYYSPIARSLEVVATGAAGSVVRSIKARIAKDSPEQYLYLSDYEVIDPTDDTAYPDGISSRMCGQGWPEAETMNQLGHRWEIYPNPANKPTRIYIGSDNLARACPEPYFSQFDVLDGRVHSNDTIKSNKAQFLGEFTTRDPRCQAVNPADSSTWSVCVNGTAQWGSAAPAWAEAVEVKRAPDPTEIGDEGCQYEGATRIIFNGDGTMTVWSKNTTTKPNDGCGSLDELSSATGAVVDVPDGSIIYVKSIDVDANPALNKEIPSKGIGGPSGKELPLGTYETKYEGLPMGSGDTYTHEVSMKYSDKFIGIGNAWIEGEAAGTVTVYADRSIVLTGDLLTEDDDNDLLGLMAGGSIEIYNPVMETLKAVVNPSASGSYLWSQPGDDQRVRATGTNVWPTDYQGDTDVLRIEAGIIAGNGSFRLQNWKIGSTTGGPAPLGEVQLFGSLAQNFRGVLGWDSGESAAPSLLSGYKKSFTYNGNLTKKRPLLFSPIGNGEWSIWWQEKVDPPKVVKT